MKAAQGKRSARNLTIFEKLDAIQRVRNGSSKASVARDIGVPESTLRGWCKNEDKLRSALAIKSENDAGMFGVRQKKRTKSDTYSPFNFTYDPKMNYVDTATNGTSLGGIDFGNSDRGIGLQNSSFNLAAISSHMKYNEDNIRSYGANANPSVEAIRPSTTLSQLSGMSDVGQSPFGMSFNKIASNLNLIEQLNNQSVNFGTGAGFSNSQSSGLSKVRQKQIANSLRANNVVESRHISSTSTMGNIGMGVDMTIKPKQPSAASLSQHSTMAEEWSKRHRQVFDSVLPQCSSPLQQQHTPSMIPAPISTPRRASTMLETTFSSSSGMSEYLKHSPLFLQLYTQMFNSMMTENLRNTKNSSHVTNGMAGCSPNVNNNISFNNNNQNNVNEPDFNMQRQVTSSTSSPVRKQKYRVDGNNKGQSKFDHKIETFRVENNDEDVNVESDLSRMSEAVEHGEKFLKWLETYSDPTITAMQVKQCRSLLQRVKTSADCANN